MNCNFSTNTNFAGKFRPVNNFSLEIYSIGEWILIGALLFLFLIQLYFILRYFVKTLSVKPAQSVMLESQISVIIPVRNEEETITSIIEELQSQNFSNAELVIVDDHSMDRTHELVVSISRKYENVKYTGVAQDVRFSEKMNINLGLKAAQSEWVIFTNPEIVDRNPEWLKNFNQYLDENIDNVDAIMAYSNIKAGKGWSRFVYRTEKLWQYMQGISFTLGGKTLIPEQENVLVRKNIYFEKGGFRQHINKTFANLELIMNEKLNSKRIRVASGDVAVWTEINEFDDISYRSLLKKSIQIRKSLSAMTQFSLAWDEASRLLLIIAFVLMGIFRPLYWPFSYILLFIYLLLLSIIWIKNLKRLKEQKLFLSSLAYILIRPLMTFFIKLPLIFKRRRNRWI